ncbi:MAG TPA: NAD(P)/FAD-dependent oxidoreductase [Nocardioides sp.]|nr:NAD(P)/FAD-dependent oxidoreductase [Nocardioides sp.]
MGDVTESRWSRRGIIAAGGALAAVPAIGLQSRAAAATQATADVVVIGAGISGLVAARRLVAAGRSVVVLEANDRVGGRTYSLSLGGGLTTEGGGQWIGPGQDRIFALVAELGLHTFPTYDDGQSIYYRNGKRGFYTGTIPPLQSPLALTEFARAEATLTAMAAAVPVGHPWDAPLAAQWDRTTFGDWLDHNVLDAEARWLIGLAFTLVGCQNPHQDSLLFMLNLFNVAGGFEAPMAVKGGAQESRVVEGTWKISDTMARQLPAGSVVLGSPVSEVQQWDTGRITVVSSLVTVTCSQVVVAMSPTEVSRIHFTPDLPARRSNLQRDGGSGSMGKLFMVYDTPFWRQGLNGGPPLNAQVLSDLMMTPYVSDNSPADGSAGVLVTFMLPTTAAPNAYLVWTDDVLDDRSLRARRLAQDLATVFGDDRFLTGRYAEKLWTNEPWIHGCVNMTAPGVLTRYTDASTAPVGNIHWAGSDTSIDNHPSYMDGAVRAGERAARELLTR